MKKEDLFRAIGEVSDDQIWEAHTAHASLPWRRYIAAAACLALVVAAALHLPRLSPSEEIKYDQSDPSLPDAGQSVENSTPDGDPAGYQSSKTHRNSSEKTKFYSENVEIGEYSDFLSAGESPLQDTSASLTYLKPEEIFAMETDIFRGTVENVLCCFTEGAYSHTFTVISVAVSEVYALRGGQLSPGDTCTIYLPVSSAISLSSEGDLGLLQTGSEAIFMPRATTADTGIRTEDGYFCYADTADYYYGEGHRFLFLDTSEGVSFAREVYQEIADAETLDEVGRYIRSMLENVEAAECSTASYQPNPLRSISGEEQPPILCTGVPLYEEP